MNSNNRLAGLVASGQRGLHMSVMNRNPKATIAYEKCCGLVKSFYVYSTAPGSENDANQRFGN